MTVDEFLSDLYNDELSDMFIGNRNAKVEARGKLFPLINKGMTQAYAKYMIAWQTVQLPITADEKTYDLADPAFQSPPLDPLAVIEVLNVYGRRLTAAECRIQGNILYFPCPTDTELQVVYKTKPVRMDESQDDKTVSILLPELLLPWLGSWVAYRTFASKKDEGSLATAQKYLQLAQSFEDVFIATNTTNESTHEDNFKLCARGFA